MALQSTISNLRDLLTKITTDLHKAEGGNKAASQRVRTNTVRLEKVAKSFRKESIHSEKTGKVKKAKKPVKATPKALKKAKPAVKEKAKPAKGRAKATIARPRAFSIKKPTAKLPTRRSSR